METVKHLVRTREHVVYTVEPSDGYLCHSEIKSGTGYDLAEDCRDVLVEHESEETVQAVACDGTWVNTGWKDGMLAHLERLLQITILWLVCQVRKYNLPVDKFVNLDAALCVLFSRFYIFSAMDNWLSPILYITLYLLRSILILPFQFCGIRLSYMRRHISREPIDRSGPNVTDIQSLKQL